MLLIFKKSTEEKINKMLHEVVLGDLKPSQLFRKMKDLASAEVSTDFLLTFWLKKLPSEMEMNLRGLSKIAPIAELLLIADGMAENRNSSQTIHEVAPSRDVEVLQKIDVLIEAISKSFNRSNRSNQDSSVQEKTAAPNVCFYHKKFGQNAFKCTFPCKFHSDFMSKNDKANH